MAISRVLRLGLIGLLLSVAFQASWASEEDVDVEVEDDEYADVERAHLVVRKFVTDSSVVQGRNVTVTIDIYNTGVSTASNIKLSDVLPENVTLVEGSITADIGKLSPGSHVKHSYTVVFNQGNTRMFLPMATVTYIAEYEGKDVQIGRSTEQQLVVLTPVQQIQKYALRVGVYASLGFAKTTTDWRNLAILLFVVGGALGINWAVKEVGVARVNRKRQQALKELEKSE